MFEQSKETAEAGRLVGAVSAAEREMAALVQEELGRPVPGLTLEPATGRLLANPGVAGLVVRAEALARRTQFALGRLRRRVQGLILGAGPAVWDHDEAEGEGWTGGREEALQAAEGPEGRPTSPGDGLKVVVGLAGRATKALSEVLELAVSYHRDRAELGGALGRGLGQEMVGRDDLCQGIQLLDRQVRRQVLRALQLAITDILILADVFEESRAGLENPRTNWEAFLYS
jgi:hypothetical protein